MHGKKEEEKEEEDEVDDTQGLGLIQAGLEAIPTNVKMNSTPFSSIKTEKV